MSDLRKAAEIALDVLLRVQPQVRGAIPQQDTEDAIDALRAALAEPVQEPPVGYFSVNDYGRWEENESKYGTPLYTAPPPPKPLTYEEIEVVANDFEEGYVFRYQRFARAIERAHGIGSKDE